MLFRGKRKNNGVGFFLFFLFTNKTVCTCLYACYLCTNFFDSLFVVKKFYVLEFNNCVCKIDENKNKDSLKKKKKKKIRELTYCCILSAVKYEPLILRIKVFVPLL